MGLRRRRFFKKEPHSRGNPSGLTFNSLGAEAQGARSVNTKANAMLGLPQSYSHYAFGVIQSGLTRAVAAAVASFPFMSDGTFTSRWGQSWLLAWLTMLLVVLFAAPFIQKLSDALTRDEGVL